MDPIKLMYIVAFILAWLFFYKILATKNKRFPKSKATIIVFLFSSLVYQFSDKIYAFITTTMSDSNTSQEHTDAPTVKEDKSTTHEAEKVTQN